MVLPILVTLVISTWGLICIGAVNSRLPSSVSINGLVILLIPLVVISAYEPILFLGVQYFVIAGGSRLMGMDRRSTPTANFSLGTLLFAIWIVTLVLVVIRGLAPYGLWTYINLVVGAFACGVATLSAIKMAAARHKSMHLLLVILLTPLIGIIAFYRNGLLTHAGFHEIPGEISWPWIGVLFGMQIIVAGWLWLWEAAADRGASRLRVLPTICRFAMTSASLLAFCIFGYTYFRLVTWPEPVRPPQRYASPNGYDDLVQAAALYKSSPVLLQFQNTIQADRVKVQNTVTEKELRVALLENKAAIVKLYDGMKKPCEQCFDPMKTANQLLNSQLMGLALVLQAKAAIATREQRFGDAADVYTDVIKLGLCIENGGPLVKAAVSRLVQRWGQARLASIRHQLTTGECDRVANQLESLDQLREPWEAFILRNRWAVEKSVFSDWLGHLYLMDGSIMDAIGITKFPGFFNSRNEMIAITRLLIADLRISAFKQNQGRLPQSLDEVASDAAVLIDPCTSDSSRLRYDANADEYELYSVGNNGVSVKLTEKPGASRQR